MPVPDASTRTPLRSGGDARCSSRSQQRDARHVNRRTGRRTSGAEETRAPLMLRAASPGRSAQPLAQLSARGLLPDLPELSTQAHPIVALERDQFPGNQPRRRQRLGRRTQPRFGHRCVLIFAEHITPLRGLGIVLIVGGTALLHLKPASDH